MKYLVKNRKTKGEILCEKVEVGETTIYITDKKIHYGYIYNTILGQVESMFEGKNFVDSLKGIIATNNKSLNLPQVVDEVEYLVDKLDTPIGLDTWTYDEGFGVGYNKAKETYSYTREDMVEFVDWLNLQYRELEHSQAFKNVGSIDELMDIWQQQITIKIEVE